MVCQVLGQTNKDGTSQYSSILIKKYFTTATAMNNKSKIQIIIHFLVLHSTTKCNKLK